MSEIFSFETFGKVITDFSYLYKDGLIYTIAIALGSVFVGIIISLFITPLRMSNSKILRFIGSTYIEIIRSTPLIVQLYIIFYGFSAILEPLYPKFELFGFIDSTRYLPCILAVGLNSGAYISEIIRAGISAVDRGQTEAARSLGMTKIQTMRFVIMPQAIKNILPSLGNEFVSVIKESSICMFIGVKDIMFMANDVTTRLYAPMEPLIVAAILYFLLTFPTSKLIAYFERRMSRGDKR